MKTGLLIVVSLVSVGSVFAQSRDADGLAVKTYLAQTKDAATAAEASATFIRDQLATLRGKLDYKADPKRSNVHSLADFKDHFGDLNDPVREAILRIFSHPDLMKAVIDAKERGLSAATNCFGRQALLHACPEVGREYSAPMIQTIEAIVDERGAVRLLEPVQLDRRHRALVTILADEPSDAHETALLSEASLAEDWNRPEEDAAWAHLQQAQ